jgi:hypothetical protein
LTDFREIFEDAFADDPEELDPLLEPFEELPEFPDLLELLEDEFPEFADVPVYRSTPSQLIPETPL